MSAQVNQLISDWPTDYKSLQYHTRSMKACMKLLFKCGILKNKIKCPNQSCVDEYMIPSPDKYNQYPKYKCCFKCEKCEKTRSITSESILYKKEYNMHDLIHFIYDFANDYTALQAHHNNGKSYGRMAQLFAIFRKCMSKSMSKYSFKLGENGGEMVIEIDESCFSKKRKYNRGKIYKPKWVFGMVDRQTGLSKMFEVPDRKRETLIRVIKENIEIGTTIYSDCFKPYWILIDEGYPHKMVNHEYEHVDQETGVHTNTIEGLWGVVKSKIKKLRGIHKHTLQYHLDEFVFRHSFIKNHNRAFELIAKSIGEQYDVSMRPNN